MRLLYNDKEVLCSSIHRLLSTIIITYLNICGILHFEIIGYYIFI